MFLYSLIIWSLAVLWLGGVAAGCGYGVTSAAATAIGGGFLGIIFAAQQEAIKKALLSAKRP